LISGQFAINTQLLSTILKYESLISPFFSPKNPQKMEKFLKIWISSFSGKLCVSMEHGAYDNMPFGLYMKNIVRFLKDD